MHHTITSAQLKNYRRHGFLRYGQIFDDLQMAEIRAGMSERIASLPSSLSSENMLNWHHCDSWILQLAVRPEIVDLVEGLIGGDIAIFMTRILSKPEGRGRAVPWHQDAHFWPLEPHVAVTCWLAIDDVTDENGPMQVIPGRHRDGLLEHVPIKSNGDLLDWTIRRGLLSESGAVSLTMPAGNCSFHDILLPHCSPPNYSPLRRCAFILRYIPTYVELNRTNNPLFDESYPLYWVRGDTGANWYANR